MSSASPSGSPLGSLPASSASDAKMNSSRVIFASFIGTAIEFYDFYVYAAAAALVIGPVFFPHSFACRAGLVGVRHVWHRVHCATDRLVHLRPFWQPYRAEIDARCVAARDGRVSTTLIGFVPGYTSIGSLAPVLLCILRFGQGIGLGGEWGGAALLATEYAPQNKRGWFGIFPQLGPSVGFLASNGLFFELALSLTDEQFRSWGWRVPFIVSAVLVALGLYVRLKIAETPAFREAIEKKERVRVPIATLFGQYLKPTLIGAIAMIVCYMLLHLDGFLAFLRRLDAAFYAREIPRSAVLRSAFHGYRDTNFRIGQR